MVHIMKTNEKLNAVSEIVTPLYENGDNHESMCESVLTERPDGIGFGEISALVKQCGIDGGFIVPLAKRRENAIDAMGIAISNDDFPVTFADYTHFIADHAETFDVPANWVKNKLNAAYKSDGIDVPEKSTVLDWQRNMVDAVRNNPDITKSQMKSRLIDCGKNETSVPVSMLGMIKYALASE